MYFWFVIQKGPHKSILSKQRFLDFKMPLTVYSHTRSSYCTLKVSWRNAHNCCTYWNVPLVDLSGLNGLQGSTILITSDYWLKFSSKKRIVIHVSCMWNISWVEWYIASIKILTCTFACTNVHCVRYGEPMGSKFYHFK